MGQQWDGRQQCGGGNSVEESTMGVSSTSKNRPSHHKSPKQFELKQR